MFAADGLTKTMAATALVLGDTYDVVPGWLVFTHVLPSFGVLPGPLELVSWHREREVQAFRDLESLSQRQTSFGIEPQTEILVGSPAEVLADRAAESDVDLVVIGHRGRSAAARVLLGSVADRLMQICGKSVLVVR